MRTLALFSLATLTFTLCLAGCDKSEPEAEPESANVEARGGQPAGAAKPGAAAVAPQGKAGSPTVGQDGTVKAGGVEVKANGDVKAGSAEVKANGDAKAGSAEVKANGDVKAGNVEVKGGTVKVPGLPPITAGQ